MIGAIIGAIVIGLIVGALARFVMPGSQNISMPMTILLGFIGSALGSWLVAQFGYHNHKGIAWGALIAGVVAAIALIAGYLALTGRKNTVSRY